MAKRSFHIGDFIVFAATVVISIGIGIYYALSGNRQRTTSEYLVGGRKMSFIPVGISLLASYESSIMMLGMPAEIYVYGIQYILGIMGQTIAKLLTVCIVVPLFHPLKITSAYEYLELRFSSRAARLVGTFMGMLSNTWYMGIVLYGPAVALQAVTGFPMWSSIFVIELVAVIYTTFGGLKAVIWTDVFQSVVMFAGVFSILIKGTIDVGGPKAVWDVAASGGRMNLFNFNPDPRIRHTFWNLFFGAIIRSFSTGFNQSTVQRISSTKSQSDAKKMLLSVTPAFTVSYLLASYEGIVAYAYYAVKRCDPFKSKALTNPNQIIPYLVMDIFEYMPGMPGVFLASLFSASLSTLSSGLSSMSALLWADVVHPLTGPRISETKATIIAKVSVVLFGGLACGVAMLVAQIGGPLTQISGSLMTAVGGPLTGLFFLGCFCPRVNAKGAIVGSIFGLIFGSWISLGMSFSKFIHKTPWLPPAPTDNCTMDSFLNKTSSWLLENSTYTHFYSNYTSSPTIMASMVTTVTGKREPKGVEHLYTISYLWISAMGTFSTLIVGGIVSFFTGMNKPGDVDPRYLIPVSGTLLIFLPGPIKRYLSSLGPQFIKEEYKAKFPDPARRLDDIITELEIKPINDEKQLIDETDNKEVDLQKAATNDSLLKYQSYDSNSAEAAWSVTDNRTISINVPVNMAAPNGEASLVKVESADKQVQVPDYDDAPGEVDSAPFVVSVNEQQKDKN